jgi:hypothetical protein
VEVVDGSGRECGDVIDGRLAAVHSRPSRTWTAEFCRVRVNLSYSGQIRVEFDKCKGKIPHGIHGGV